MTGLVCEVTNVTDNSEYERIFMYQGMGVFNREIH